MADHDEEEELLEIRILLLLLRRRNRKERKVPTPRKRNVWVRKVHLVQELSLGFIFEVGRLFIVLIIYIQKFLDSDWLRVMQFLGNTMQK